METYITTIPQELLQEMCLYLDHTSIIKLRKISNSNINFQYLTSVKFPGFYKIFKTVREESDDYRGFPYEKGHDLVYQLDKFLKQGLNESGRLISHIDISFINIYSNDANYLRDLLQENYAQNELRDISLSYRLSQQDSTLPQARLYKYRIEFPNVYQINSIFINSCDDYHYSTRNLTTIEEFKNVLESMFAPLWEKNHYYYSSMVNLSSHFLMFLDHTETMEIFRDKPLEIKSDDKDNMISGENYQDYLVLFNCVKEYLKDKLNKIN